MRGALVIIGLFTTFDATGVTVVQPAAERQATVWDGVYSEAQVRRGMAIYPSICGKCHGRLLNGAPDDPDMVSTPPIAGPKFLRDWDGASLATLLSYTRTTMPANNPGFLSDGEYADLVAYMLSMSGARVGETALSSDPGRLTGIVIRQPQ